MNCDKQCRAPFIAVEEDGRCIIKDEGPYGKKSDTERYVEIEECRAQKCNHWEKDEVTGRGTCNLSSEMFFLAGKIGPPKCVDFLKQIDEPGFAATVDDE